MTTNPTLFWHPSEPAPDTYYAFRGLIEIDQPGQYELRTVGASWYRAWLNGDEMLEGPLRYPAGHPEYDRTLVNLLAGPNCLAILATYRGTPYHRTQSDIQPYLWVEVVDPQTGQTVSIAWKCAQFGGQTARHHQINPLLGWGMCLDTRVDPSGWKHQGFDDSNWLETTPVNRKVGPIAPATIGSVAKIKHTITPVSQGLWAERYGHQCEEFGHRFFTRDLTASEFPADGIWRRYDLGKVWLGQAEFEIEAPAGVEVEVAYSEFLVHDRVTPYILGGSACNLDHFVTRGGQQTMIPLEPRGGRYVELHIKALPDQVKILEENYYERTYHTDVQGNFSCGDLLLDRIWQVGVETYRSCAEDALTDNPTRERGQWTGDVVNVGLDIGVVAFGDSRLLRRALVQAATTSRDDGLVAAMSAGFPNYIPSFAAQWVRACLRYHELTGDDLILTELWTSAQSNIAAFEAALTPNGVDMPNDFNFVDWGYVRPDAPTDMTLNLFFLDACQSMLEWSDRIEHHQHKDKYQALAEKMRTIIESWLAGKTANPEQLGYHCTALALRYNMVPPKDHALCLDYLKQHLADCFPNNPKAPRLGSPVTEEKQLITPYFAHFVLPVLIAHGEVDFVYEQFRSCWGWFLENDVTTWPEVFDLRWSHCHVWSGCPTWILSRYALGLHSCFQHGQGCFVCDLQPGELTNARGILPIPNTHDTIKIEWHRQEGKIHYNLTSPTPINIRLPGSEEFTRVKGEWSTVLEG